MTVDLGRVDYLYFSIKKLIKLYLYGIFLMSVYRFSFFWYFAEKDLWKEYSSDILYAVYMGLRYDTMVLSYVLIVPFLLFSFFSILKIKKLINFANFINGIWAFFILIIIAAVLLIDIGFYSYFQDHINILVFGIIEDDTKALALTIWKNYPIGIALGGVGIFLIFHFFTTKKIFKFIKTELSVFNPGFFKFIFSFLFVFTLIVAGSRGGFGELVLAPRYADFSRNQFINDLALNGLITLEKAIRLRIKRSQLDFNLAENFGYGENIHKAFSDYLGVDTTPTKKEHLFSLVEQKTGDNNLLDEVRPNVIVIVMESFGSYWLRYNSESFNLLGSLKEHFESGINFENFISSDNGTIGSLMAIATNIPDRPGTRYLSESRYMQMRLECAAHVPYKSRGYETSFIYGGKLGWRDIGKYFQVQEFHNVEGESHIESGLALSGRYGTEWGVYDEHFFNYILRKLENAKRPQFILGLSTSNHPPFEWPAHYDLGQMNPPDELKNRITRDAELFVKRMKAFRYANQSLGDFLTKLKNSPLGQKTIVAVTGDHNFWGFMNYEGAELYEKYKVPLYFHVPEKIKPPRFDSQKFGSHEDIMPTLYNISLSKTNYLAFGRNLFGENESFSLNTSVNAGTRGVIDKEKRFFEWDSIPGKLIKLEESNVPYRELELYLKSTLTVADYYLRSSFEQNKLQKD